MAIFDFLIECIFSKRVYQYYIADDDADGLIASTAINPNKRLGNKTYVLGEDIDLFVLLFVLNDNSSQNV